MKSYDQVKTLSSFRIVIDTREHVNERAKRRYMQFGVPFERRKLDVADYTYDAVLPSGRSILECREPVALIERKMDINELVGCFVGRKNNSKMKWSERLKLSVGSFFFVRMQVGLISLRIAIGRKWILKFY